MVTEKIHPDAHSIDALEVEEILSLMSSENLSVVESVNRAAGAVAETVRDVVDAISKGGSLIYVGAGTSGRLGVLDASEMPPTFSVPSYLVRGIIAGGRDALTTSVEGAEDDVQAGIDSMEGVSEADVVLGISAGGGAPFVLAALKEAKRRGARCRLLTCVDQHYEFLDGVIQVIVGPEIVAGSTRLKAGTATKMVLNMITTTAMIRLGRVYRGYMVDVAPKNKKLLKRAERIVRELVDCTEAEAAILLEAAAGNPKTAVVMALKHLSRQEALDLLGKNGGSLRKTLHP